MAKVRRVDVGGSLAFPSMSVKACISCPHYLVCKRMKKNTYHTDLMT